MRRRGALIAGLALACAAAPAPAPVPSGRTAGASLEVRLGYPAGRRLLILHFDDLGVAGPENRSAWAARDSGLPISASVIVPGPRFQEVAAYARAHPDFDLGIHLALTSEWPGYRWGPIAPPGDVPTLLDPDSLLRRAWTDTTAVRWQDVERELRAQVTAARAAGIRPSHLDVHEYVLFTRGPVLFEILRRVAQDEGVPFLSAREWIAGRAPMRRLPSGPLELARVVAIGPDIPPAEWSSYYNAQIRALPAGVSELILHPAADSTAMKALTQERVNWGAAWRARDWAYVASPRFRRLLREQNIHLVTWRQIDSVLAAAPSSP
ncbi:MAG TPA: ChbG/HpnK family deacetylase [Gemmatimonadales bacterium]